MHTEQRQSEQGRLPSTRCFQMSVHTYSWSRRRHQMQGCKIQLPAAQLVRSCFFPSTRLFHLPYTTAELRYCHHSNKWIGRRPTLSGEISSPAQHFTIISERTSMILPVRFAERFHLGVSFAQRSCPPSRQSFRHLLGHIGVSANHRSVNTPDGMGLTCARLLEPQQVIAPSSSKNRRGIPVPPAA